MDKKKVKEVMSWMGKRNTPKQTATRRENVKKARAKRWAKKVLDKDSHTMLEY